MKLNLILAKIFQFVVSLAFITMVLFYFSVLLMLPLAVLWYAIQITALVSPWSPVSVAVGIAALGYLGLRVYQMPDLVGILLGIGIDLAEFGFKQKDRFGPLVGEASIKPA